MRTRRQSCNRSTRAETSICGETENVAAKGRIEPCNPATTPQSEPQLVEPLGTRSNHLLLKTLYYEPDVCAFNINTNITSMVVGQEKRLPVC